MRQRLTSSLSVINHGGHGSARSCLGHGHATLVTMHTSQPDQIHCEVEHPVFLTAKQRSFQVPYLALLMLLIGDTHLHADAVLLASIEIIWAFRAM